MTASGAKDAAPKAAVLLCTRDAGRFLREQMDSLFRQTYANWELWVSDDASRDDTRDIVAAYAGRGKRIAVVDGPNRGAAANFLFLTRSAETDAAFFAWADADDIWLPDKLERAVLRLSAMDGERPALYCARTEVVDERNRLLGSSPLFSRPPCFRNALCQCIAGGNTMAFNRKTRELLRHGNMPDIVSHDWWAYLLVSGCGGAVHYDPVPCLRYRQHGANQIGANLTLRAKLSRCRNLLRGAAREWNRKHLAALAERRELLAPECAMILDAFAAAHGADGIMRRLGRFRRSGAHRQSLLHQLALYAAAVLRRYP